MRSEFSLYGFGGSWNPSALAFGLWQACRSLKRGTPGLPGFFCFKQKHRENLTRASLNKTRVFYAVFSHCEGRGAYVTMKPDQR